MGYEDGGWGAGQWFVMGTMMLIFWALVIALVVWAVRGYRSGAQPGQTKRETPVSPAALLGERYARGEIGEVEYLRGRELLQTAALSPSSGKSTP